MPHKHKRKRDDDKSNFDLPPDVRAKSLPVIQPTKHFLEPRKRPKLDKRNGRNTKNIDDTPKSFARLMAWHKDGKKLRSGLDDGKIEKKVAKKKKQQVQQESTANGDQQNGTASTAIVDSSDQTQPANKQLKILPGESLAEFNVRVDQSMPLSAVSKHNSVKIPGVRDEHRLTKHNKRLARMQSEWRNTDAKLREKKEEEDEDNEEKREEDRLLWMDVQQSKVKGKKKRHAEVEEDPWKQLEKKRLDSKQKSLQDVVQAPPMLDASRLQKMKKLFKASAAT